jgi:hypothetical protein
MCDPKNPKQKVASGKINGLQGVDKFHGCVIPSFWVKVDVAVIHMVDIPLMHSRKVNDQVVV